MSDFRVQPKLGPGRDLPQDTKVACSANSFWDSCTLPETVLLEVVCPTCVLDFVLAEPTAFCGMLAPQGQIRHAHVGRCQRCARAKPLRAYLCFSFTWGKCGQALQALELGSILRFPSFRPMQALRLLPRSHRWPT